MMKLPISYPLPKESKAKLLSVKQSLEKYFYAVGVNIALHKTLRSSQYQEFKDRLSSGIKKQILHIATIDKVNQIIKSRDVKKSDSSKMLVTLGLIWLSMEDIINPQTAILAYLLWGANEGGQAALDKMAPGFEFDLENKLLLAKFDKRVEFLLKTVDETTQKWIVSTIEQGMKSGLGVKDIVSYLRDKANGESIERADLIAETELAYAIGLVELAVYKHNNIDKHKWICAQDERTCERCVSNEEAGAIEVGREFPTGVTTVPDHIRCRCYLLPVLPVMLEDEVWTGG